MKRIAGLALVLAACASSETEGRFSDPSSTSSSGGFATPDGGSSVGADGCAEAARLVYVLSAEDDLYSFRPDALTFKKIGRLSCPGSTSPNSMAVDRTGIAWVNTSDGSLYKVSTADARCSETTFSKGQSGFTRFGMAFASNESGSQDETLFVSGIDEIFGGPGLARVDLASLKLTPIANYPGALNGLGAELTGTGEGKLYGFFTTDPNATLALIAKTNAQTSESKELAGVSTGTAWAFSFWGGDFWFYTSSGGPSKVTRLAASGNGAITTAMDDVGGFRIVGAGVSTCAPTSPPR